MDVSGVLTTGVVFAAAGGGLGAIWAIDRVKGRWVPALLGVPIGMIFAGAVAEYFLPNTMPLANAAVGIIAGVVSGYALDALKAVAPQILPMVLERIVRTGTSFMDSLVKAWLEAKGGKGK
ncbi:MAG: hypothetical protein KBC57_03150 [Neisseriaceae bacterium]|nr:hypothetical protein [Neisseriaceae bacterium]